MIKPKGGNINCFNAITDIYYERVGTMAIDERIREAIIKVANKVADEIISQYQIKRLVKTHLVADGVAKEKMIIAIEIEKKSKP